MGSIRRRTNSNIWRRTRRRLTSSWGFVAQHIERYLDEDRTGAPVGQQRECVIQLGDDFPAALRTKLRLGERRAGAELLIFVVIPGTKALPRFVNLPADEQHRNRIGERGSQRRGGVIYAGATDRQADAGPTGRAGVAVGHEGGGLLVTSQDVADILLDLAMREKMNESNLFARMLTHAFLRKNVRLLPNSHRSAGFAVLKAPDVPSVLIETGFISNPDEAKLLSSGQFQRNIASAILEGVDDYFRKIQALQKP